jgi:zinc transport system permease protein
MAYFGEALSHSALLGAALGLVLGISSDLMVIGVCIASALLLPLLERARELASDTLIGILAQAALSLGVVLIAFHQGLRIDLFAYLFGDILSVSDHELPILAGGAVLVLVALRLLWRPLLSVAVDQDVARVEGVKVEVVRLAFMLLIALVVAVAAKLVGVLLVTAMLIIPAASARCFARSPEMMAVLAAVFGILAVSAGVGVSFHFDAPTGPCIVLAATVIFIAGRLLPGVNGKAVHKALS